jgi:hypothetical protein
LRYVIFNPRITCSSSVPSLRSRAQPILFFYAIGAEVILLISAYARNEKETLSNEDKKSIHRIVEAFTKGLSK